MTIRAGPPVLSCVFCTLNSTDERDCGESEGKDRCAWQQEVVSIDTHSSHCRKTETGK
jgi:hypothetical protein